MPRERILTGIDIGSSKITTVIASHSEEGRLSVIGVSTVPSRGIKKGVVVDIDDAVESIASCLEGAERMAGYAVSSAFVSIDGNHISSQNSHGVVAVHDQDGEIEASDVNRVTEAARAISLPESREIIHVLPRGFIVDSQEGVRDPVGMSGIRLEVETNIVSGASAVMRNLAKCVQQVAVDVDELVYSGIASAEAVLSDTEKELGCALIDIGGGTSKIAIYIGGSPAYATVIPVGGQNITNDIAVGLRTNLESAEQIKIRLSELREYTYIEDEEEEIAPETKKSMRKSHLRHIDLRELGLDMPSVPESVFSEIINPRLTEIFKLIGSELRKSGYGKVLPSGIIVTGGTAGTVGLEHVAKVTLQMPFRIGKPTGLSGLVEEIQSPAYSTVSGLILYAATAVPSARSFGAIKGGGVGEVAKKTLGWFKSFMP
jgi:cell division protein FtsA